MSLIHRYQSNGYNIVLDINSGCIHLVDEVTYEVLPYLEEGMEAAAIAEKLGDRFKKEDVETSVTECKKLQEQGMLFTKDIYENIIDEFTKNRQTVVKALCLHIAHDCNLACRYCFAEEGEYHGRRALMSFEVGKKALDFLIANSGSRKNVSLVFRYRMSGRIKSAVSSTSWTFSFASRIAVQLTLTYRFIVGSTSRSPIRKVPVFASAFAANSARNGTSSVKISGEP